MPPPTLYTMGQPGDPDLRGGSMVQKHTEKLQREKEDAAFKKLSAAFPDLGKTVLAHALQECNWEADQALKLLERFHSAAADILENLKQKHKRARPEPDEGSSESESDSSSDDSEEDRRRSKKRREKKHKKKKDSKKDSKKAKLKKAKKESRDDKVMAGPGAQYGKYGIIKDSDLPAKQAEFMQWAAEVKRVDAGSLGKIEERELFAEYVEDYNTATLPSRKYYNADAYNAKLAAKAARKGEKQPAGEMGVFNDEEQLRREIKERREADAAERLKEAYNEIKYTAPDKAKDMREQEIMRIQMSHAYRTGDHSKAAKLAERLMPDEQKEALEQRRRNA